MRVFNRQEKAGWFPAVLALLTTSFLLSACSKTAGWDVSSAVTTANFTQVGQGLNNPENLNPTLSPPPTTQAAYEPLDWETSDHPERKAWSAAAEQMVLQKLSSFDQAQDAFMFCPNYPNLTQTQKVNFWAQLIVGVAYYESSWDPTSRYDETTLGIDALTGQSVYSEGLLQMSYDDVQSYPFCQFNWTLDKNLAPTDPNKTILNPQINLDCGIQVLAEQIANYGFVVMSSHLYWSTLRQGNSTVAGIEQITQKLSFCQ